MSDTPHSDDKAFSTGNAFILLHKDAQEIERTLRAENTILREKLADADTLFRAIDAATDLETARRRANAGLHRISN